MKVMHSKARTLLQDTLKPRIIALPILLLLAAGLACAQERPGKSTPDKASPAFTSDVARKEDQLIGALRASFKQRNAKLAQVGVLDLRAWDFLGPRVVIGWAIVGDRVFRGSFDDEMFGVFVVDESLTRVERVIDTFPTQRWFDYEVRFGKFTADSIEVVGKGATYGDQPMRRAYKWW